MNSETRSIYRKSLIAFFIIFMSSVILDQVSKIHAERTLLKYSHEKDLKIYQGSTVPVFVSERIAEKKPGLFFGFTYVRNQGAAWGALNDLDDKYRIPFFYLVTSVAIVMIFFFLKSTPLANRLPRYALILVLSGAVGNFIDRLRLGYVIDWIDFKWNILGWYYDFPKFNVADSCISVGIGLLIFDMIVLEKRRNTANEKIA